MIVMKIFRIIKEFLFSLFRKIEYFDLLEEYEDYVRGQNIEVHDTLVGTVKSREQYEINYKYSFYHIPAYCLDRPDEIKYVALYRSKNIFGDDEPGVKHYGKVISYSKIKRRDIKELMLSFSPDELYYKFEILEWNTMEFPICAKECGPRIYLLANKYVFDNAKYFNELFISNNDEYKLHMGLMDITSGVYDGFFVGDCKVRATRKKIIVKLPNKTFKYRIEEYKRSKLNTLKKISEIVLPD